MLDVKQFRDLVVIPVLNSGQMGGEAATNLVLGTAIQESRLTYLKQLHDGPALGLFQMEPATHDDIWENYLAYRPDLARWVSSLTPFDRTSHELIGNLWYSTAMCRVHYRRDPEPLPAADDIEGLAEYWKRVYNTYEGAGTVEEFIENWNEATFGL